MHVSDITYASFRKSRWVLDKWPEGKGSSWLSLFGDKFLLVGKMYETLLWPQLQPMVCGSALPTKN